MNIRPSENCIVAPFGEGVAILDRRTNHYFSLDEVGAVIWSVIERPEDGPPDTDDLVAVVTSEFDVPPEACRPDIEAFVAALRAAGLVEPAPA